MDIALVNLWKYLESQGATEYSYYHKSDTDKDTPILDIARENDKFMLYRIILWYLSDKLSSIICIERGKAIIIVPPVK